MKSNLIPLLLILFAMEAEAQSTQTIEPFKSSQISEPQQAMPDLNLKDWNKGIPSPSGPPGLTLYFDYTKFFKWLLPKKHPKIPPECDPKFFLNDSIPAAPIIKQDTIRGTKPPV